jgi:uncharacterized radical SAM superfamily protein
MNCQSFSRSSRSLSVDNKIKYFQNFQDAIKNKFINAMCAKNIGESMNSLDHALIHLGLDYYRRKGKVRISRQMKKE